ncbi:arylsulfatase [Akkermansiaceae bacterium]|nr:arylsulfatase [Akkermansiaceae bacterium]MDA9830500.1 arylsulfatase [Akkermansiaceae bacterium]
MSKFLLFFGLLILPLFSSEKPNIVVIMVDDLGFSDIGCYGGEIETPSLDRLAANGLRFSQFYNTAKCHSSRVSLLTGQYCLAAGDVALTHAVTSAEVLRDAGYFTAMTGKWHLKKEPTDFGFQRYWGHLSGACNFFKGDSTFRLNGKPWQVPKSDFYTTVANVDFALNFLEESRKKNNPFYLYLAFNAPHAPLHALPEDYAKYKGRYDSGWDKVRDARIAKQKELGILSRDLQPSPRPSHIRAWDKIVSWQQKYEVNRMVTLAAMIDRVDQEIGRLIKDLEKHNQLDNTLILFVSDNGACPYDRRKPLLDVEPTDGDTFLADSTGWAWARNSPFRYYKQNQFEGGISSPGIVHWPAGLKTKPGAISHTPVHLIDVLPTLSEFASTKIPKEHPDRTLRPVSGISFAPIFKGQPISRKSPLHFQFASDFALRDGDWKAVSFKGQEWELYHLKNDRTELENLAGAQAERLKKMVTQWQQISRDVLHSPKLANPKINPTQSPRTNREWTNFSDSIEPPAASQKRIPRKNKKTDPLGIRARKNTELVRLGKSLSLTFTGEDPGIAMDLRSFPKLSNGPYHLTFELITNLEGTGNLFYTVDRATILPKGPHLNFPVRSSTEAQKFDLTIPTEETLNQLRLDVAQGPGKAIIRNLKLLDRDKKVLVDWTASGK